MSGYINVKQVKLLALRSGDQCAFTNCSCRLSADATSADDAAVIGKIAHIRGEKPGSARYDPNMTDDQRQSYPNLLYMCPTHHDLVDNQSSTYTVNDLLKMKSDHEQLVRRALTDQVVRVDFQDLDEVCRVIGTVPLGTPLTFSVIYPRDKMERNSLTERVDEYYTLGAMKLREVGNFIEGKARLDLGFPDRLKAGFVQRYVELRAEGFTGDDLYLSLVHFAQAGKLGIKQQAASLAVLAYLFEKCEVFEI